MHLLENPFFLLDAGPDVPAPALVAHAELHRERIGEAADCALGDLLDPAARLAAELAWLPHVRPGRARQLLRILAAAPSDEQPVHGLPPLARANALASALLSARHALPLEGVHGRIGALADAAASIEPREVLEQVNEARSHAGVEPVAGLEDVERALEGRRAFYMAAALQALVACRS